MAFLAEALLDALRWNELSVTEKRVTLVAWASVGILVLFVGILLLFANG